MKLEEPQHDLRDSPIPVADLQHGRAVLIRGPAMTGKYDLLLELLSALAARSILVSTSRQAEGARADFAAYGDPDQLWVADCASRIHGREPESSDRVRYASSPRNLTEVGVKFTELLGCIEADGEAAVGVHSISELVMYTDVQQVYQFLTVLLAECRGVGWPMVAVVDDAAVGDQSINTLTEPFDVVVSTRRTDHRELRYCDSTGEESGWAPF